MAMRASALVFAALFLATGTAHADYLKPFVDEPSKQQVWRCGNIYVVVNPIDLTWEYNRADFVRGGDTFTIWNNHLYQRYGQQNIPCEWPWKRKQADNDSNYLYRSKTAKYVVYLGGLPLVL
jgi:hypothetical protein